MARLPRLPDLLTTANLACGVLSVLAASQGRPTIACGLVFAAAVFDVLDGLAARATGGGTPLGAQLDSLADLVSFGLAPAFALFIFSGPHGGPDGWLVAGAAVVLTAASCWRLAKFNLDVRQATGFLGLPTPANGLFWASLVLGASGTAVLPGPGHGALLAVLGGLFASPSALLAGAVALSVLMLSELPLPSLKFKRMAWRGNEVVLTLAAVGAVLAALYGILSVPLTLALYALSPVWGRAFGKGA